MRQSRKLDHLKYSLQLGDGPGSNRFEDITLIHNCIPNMAWDDIDLSGSLGGLSYHHPIVINAITGGAEDVTAFNGRLAELAREIKAIMAVGSQYAALEFPETRDSFQIVRKKNPHGIILANLGAHATPLQAEQVIEMIDAQGIQIHLNAAQELIMAEGDRNFFGYLENITRIVERVKVPVIVKEVGCGIAFEQAKELMQTGIKAIDVGGAGGTNFLAIEAARSQLKLSPEILQWGIPTAISTIELVSTRINSNIDIMVSGGIRTPLEAVKALVLGGSAVGIATPVLKLLSNHDVNFVVNWFNNFLIETKLYMVLLGCTCLKEMWQVPAIIGGYAKEWLTNRGIDVTQYAIRKKHG